MAIRKETRIATSNTLEEWRIKSNEISLHLGDTDQLATDVGDKVFSTTASANAHKFSGTRFELSPENTLDNTAGYIILKGNPTMTGFVVDTTIFQGADLANATFKGTIEGVINDEKILVKNVTGTYSASEILKNGTQTIAVAKQSRLVTESHPIGIIRVYNDATELPQTLTRGGFHVVNHQFDIVLTGSPTLPATFNEGATLYQGTNLASATWSGTMYDITSTLIRLKSASGSFSASTILKVDGSTGASNQIAAAKITSGGVTDYSFGTLIELHTPADNGDVIKIKATNVIDAINELQDDVGTVENLTTTATDLQAAINEHDAELGTITAGALGTTASTVSTAIREHEDQIGNTAYGTSAGTISAALKEHGDELGTITAGAMGTAASTVSTAIKEHEDQIGNVSYSTTAQTITGALNELETAARAANSNYTLTTTAPDFRSAINELDAELGTITAGAMGTTAATVGGAIAEHQADIGTVGNLTTTATSVVTAINELDLKQGNAALATSANTLSGAINELHTESDASVRLTSGSAQTLNFDMTYGSNGKTMTFASGTTLDLSNGTLLLSAAGNVANFGSAFLNLNATAASGSNVNIQGLQVDRSSISGGAATHDVRLQWNETRVAADPEEAWELIGMNTSGATNTASILTRYNAFNLFANNTESGINATWDSTNQNVDFNVDDFTVTLGTGPISGNFTVTNLANATFNTTLDNNSVTLGTHTTGNYVATIAGTANEITVTGSGSETAGVTIALPDDVTIGNDLVVTDYTRTAGLRVGTSGTDPGDNNLAVNGNATIAGNTTITGNLTVNGTQTTLSTATLEVEDTLVLVGSDLGNTNEPSTGGFGLETRKFSALGGTTINGRQWESDGTHPDAASNVDGSHSIVYNFATDRWEADGSLILSSATLGSPDIKINNGSSLGDLDAGSTLEFKNGTGTTVAGAKVGNDFEIEVTNTDRGSTQNIFKNFQADSGGTATANTNNDTFDIAGGTLLSTVRSGHEIAVNHDNVTRTDTTATDTGAYVKSITTNAQGHITAVDAGDFDDYYYKQSEFTSANTVSKPVIRDGNGDFSARIITADLSGNASSASNASLLDSIDSASFLRSDAADTLGAVLTVGTNGRIDMDVQDAIVAGNYGHGVYGLYSASKYQHVWSMGTAYDMDASGANLGNLYGLAYTHSNVGVDYAGSHQLLHVTNGTVTCAMGTNLYTTGTVIANGGNSTQWNSAYSDTNAAVSSNTANRLVKRDANGDFSARIITADLSGTASNISSQANSATIAAATANTANNIVLRDANGDFSARIITATLSGQASTIANQANSATIAASDAAGNSTIVRRTSAGYIFANYLNTTANDVTSGVTKIMVETGNDNYIRHGDAGSVRSFLNVANGANNYSFPYTITSGNTANTVVFRDASGNFTAGTISAALSGNATTATTASNVTMNHSDSNANYPIVWRSSNTAYYTDEIYLNPSSNTIYATDVVATSDERLKDKVGTIDNALDKVCAIDGFLYKWNDKYTGKDDTVQVGVSAQDVEKVLPEAVNELETGYKGVKYDKLVPLLIEAIKELREENINLRSDIEDLKSINS